MRSCLGIYSVNKVMKYAKITADKDNNISVDSCGAKFIVGEKQQLIHDIIKETGSNEVPIATNIEDLDYTKVEIFDSLNKKDIESLVQIEFEDAANRMGINDKILTYKYSLGASIKNESNYTATIITAKKATIEDQKKTYGNDLKGIYSYPLLMNNTVSKADTNYMFVSMEEDTNISIVLDGKIAEIKKLEIGMKDIIDKIAFKIGSYDKAYELCKSINVYSENENTNDPEVEAIIEPILQDILHRIETELKPVKIKVKKIIIAGIGTLFTNIDMLFEKYFGVKSEILKPAFIKDMGAIKNLTEIVEANAAISLAQEILIDKNQDLNFALDGSKKNVFQKKDVSKDKLDKLKQFAFEGDSQKIAEGLIVANIIIGTALLLYIIFGSIYNFQINNMKLKLDVKINEAKTQTKTIESDIAHISQETEKYSSINNLIKDTTDKIEGNTISKYSTYNVANFMQKIVKYIPKNVQLITIASDDNKTVTITAKSDSYAALGYFVSQLKLEGILAEVVTKNVSHGSYIVVTIEGVLP